MMKTKKQLIVGFLSFVLLLGMMPSNAVSAAKKPSLSSKNITVTKGKSKTLTVKNTKTTVKWKIMSGKSYIALKKKSKMAATITGKKKGTAKVQATVGKTKLTCKVTVKNATSTPSTAKPSNTPSPSNTPLPSNPTNTHEQDVAALKKLIAEQRELGASVSEDINNSEQYKWKDGKLIKINWGDLDNLDYSGYKLSGKLDVSGCVNLISLYCCRNQLTSLDVSKNVNLSGLGCWENQLTSLDVSKNVNLTVLDCSRNQLTSLDVSNNVNLTFLDCSLNQLTSLDVSNNVNLTFLDCSLNQLTSLDVSNNVNLEYLGCDSTVTVTGYNK